MKKKAKRVQTKRVEKEPEYSITFAQGDLVSQGTGATLLEALQSVPRPMKIGKTIMTVTKNGHSIEQVLQPMRAKRFFFPIAQKFLAKQLEVILK